MNMMHTGKSEPSTALQQSEEAAFIICESGLFLSGRVIFPVIFLHVLETICSVFGVKRQATHTPLRYCLLFDIKVVKSASILAISLR
ncbi:hypothetical protein VU01_13572 [Candidatus Electrothrix marina]|uniref:Uncharacterized protein n=1 Tax=Candidatus Electrothrix marina TaxID=1859130 RepID=A0A444JB00_9BACT|nr:hypothetical protein VU01_13572 [Candidatus Electrothrix marina]